MDNKKKRPMTEYKALTIAAEVISGKRKPLSYWTFDANAYAAGFTSNPHNQKAAEAYAELAEATKIIEELRERIKAQPILKNNLRLF